MSEPVRSTVHDGVGLPSMEDGEANVMGSSWLDALPARNVSAGLAR